MPNRDKQSMIFGMGIGVVITAFVMFIFYIVQRQAHFNEVNDLNEHIEWLQDELAVRRQEQENIVAIQPQTQPPTQPMTEPETEMPTEVQTQPATGTQTTTSTESEPIIPTVGTIMVHIPVNISASNIAAILRDAGVVTNLNAFLAFLEENNFDRSLMAGNFWFPVGASYEEIMEQILTGRFR
ncbi:MAG: hypothetical protein FWE44_01715 [Defluviitaleaceae bacterium]|nr:hypothetical protein [Defluviitaleaceae bacterium]